MFDKVLMKTRTPILQILIPLIPPSLEKFKSVGNISGIYINLWAVKW